MTLLLPYIINKERHSPVCMTDKDYSSPGVYVTTRVVRPHAPVNHMVFFLCHGFIKFMYINKTLMTTRL